MRAVNLRVLAIYPAFDVQLNEMAIAWRTLCEREALECTVLAGVNSPLKGQSSEVKHEQYANLSIHRFPAPLQTTKDVLSVAQQVKPNLIFCAVAINMRVALAIQETTCAPIVLHNEYFLDDTMMVRRRHYLGINLLRAIESAVYRGWLARRTALILSSNPKDFENPNHRRCPTLHYLPWPHPYQGSITPFHQRDKNLSVYIGSIFRAKGADVLCYYYSCLLRKQPGFKLVVVGPSLDRVGQKALQILKDIGQQRVVIQPKCSRAEALNLISRSLFVFSPGRRLGWGLIGDAWVTGTPVLAVEEHYDLRDEENCWVVRSGPEFVDAAVVLQSGTNRWQELSMGGLQTVTTCHSIQVSISTLFDRLCEVAGHPSVGRHLF
jgi:glycosyltransferase involved in cell wall biosynthesis